MPGQQLIVFDFDWSFADQDTDRYVLEVLAPKLRFQLREDKAKMQYTDAVAKSARGLHELGKSRSDIEGALQLLPVHPAMKRGTTNLKSRGLTTFLCLSNSNYVYITTILKHHELMSLFDEIITNPAAWKDNGLLEIRRRVSPDGPQHGCKVGCSANMCKGEELEAFIARRGGWDAFERVAYVGDGGNDYCPVLRLRENDMALVRKFRELQRRIEREGKTGSGIKCTLAFWGGAFEVEALLDQM